MNDRPPVIHIACPFCGASVPLNKVQCWLCHSALPNKDGTVVAELVQPPTFAPQPFSFSLASIFAITAVAAVGFGLVQVDPGLSVLYAIVVVPSLIVTVVRTRREQVKKGRELSFWERAMTFIVSSAVVFVALWGVSFAMIGVLFFLCILALSGGGFR